MIRTASVGLSTLGPVSTSGVPRCRWSRLPTGWEAPAVSGMLHEVRKWSVNGQWTSILFCHGTSNKHLHCTSSCWNVILPYNRNLVLFASSNIIKIWIKTGYDQFFAMKLRKIQMDKSMVCPWMGMVHYLTSSILRSAESPPLRRLVAYDLQVPYAHQAIGALGARGGGLWKNFHPGLTLRWFLLRVTEKSNSCWQKSFEVSDMLSLCFPIKR